MKMNRNVNEKIAEWGRHNGYEVGELTVVQALLKLRKQSKSRAQKYYKRFYENLSQNVRDYVEEEILA